MIVREGKTELEIPDYKKISKKASAFYNPEKEFDRDLTIGILKAFFKNRKGLVFCDLLSASGIRVLRFATEIKGVSEVYAFEKNPKAFETIMNNLLKNKGKIEVEVHALLSDANKALYNVNKFFDFIDVDPFGSPNPFLHASVGHIKKRGALIAVTATDSSALVGSYPRACRRKYHSRIMRTPFFKEAGIRILIKHCIEVGAEKEIALTPVFSYSRLDYFRVFFSTDRGASRCDKLLSQIGFYDFNPKTLETKVSSRGNIGPAFMGAIWDTSFVKNLEKTHFIKTILAESKIKTPYYYHIPSHYKKMRESIPKTGKIILDFKKKGKDVSRTHFDPEALRVG